MSTPHTALAAAADDRKARLAKLKSLKRKQPEDEAAPPESDHASPQPPEKDVARLHLSGRNYDPETRGPKLGFEAPPTLDIEDQTLEAQAAELEAEIRKKQEEEAQDDKGIDLFKLQPKKPNWDLKRELNKKLEILNVRTDNAIARLVRERLSAKKTVEPAHGNSGAGAAQSQPAVGEAGAALEGAALVEGLRLREQEEEAEERREREADELDVA